MTFILALLIQADVDRAVEKLKQTRISVDLDNAPLEDFVEIVSGVLGETVIVDPAVWERFDGEALRVSVKLDDVRVHSLLKLTLKPRGLTLTLRGGVYVVVPQEATGPAPVTRIYDTQDVILPMPSFEGSSVAEDYRSLYAHMAGVHEEEATFEDVFGDGEKALALTRRAEAIEQAKAGLRMFLETQTGGDSWTRDARTAIRFAGAKMVVTQSAAVHAEIDRLLREMRKFQW